MPRRIVSLHEEPAWKEKASTWFHEKWDVPQEEYIKSMEECIRGEQAVPQWYILPYQGEILAGVGVIENDFHDRKDLAPNVCAFYVEKEWRNHGIAGQLLAHVTEDMHQKGVDTLYLITDHTSFYERYGWKFLCMVQEEDGNLIRMYTHQVTD
ncbi:MAG: GNAT family N-acetyltransferase [Lachnospirales bacterium]